MVKTKEVNNLSGKSFMGNGHWFGSGGGNGVNVTVHTSP